MQFEMRTTQLMVLVLTILTLGCSTPKQPSVSEENANRSTSTAPSPTSLDEQVFPLSDDEPIPSFTEVAKAMIGDPSITVAEAEEQLKRDLARRYTDGGERYYSAETGEIVSDMPKSLFANVPEEHRVLLYAARWLRENAPVRVACMQRNFKIVKDHPSFLTLARSCLFRTQSSDDENRLARSIARNFCLGGEYRVHDTIPSSQWKREKSIGPETFATVSQYVDLLLKIRGNPRYCAVVSALKAPENAEKVKKLAESYK